VLDSSATQVSKGRGRLEIRTLTTSEILNAHVDWPGLGQVYRLERQFSWLRAGSCYKQTCETEYGITSLTCSEASPLQVLQNRREHWFVETGMALPPRCYLTRRCNPHDNWRHGRSNGCYHQLDSRTHQTSGFYNAAQGRKWFTGHLDRALTYLPTQILDFENAIIPTSVHR